MHRQVPDVAPIKSGLLREKTECDLQGGTGEPIPPDPTAHPCYQPGMGRREQHNQWDYDNATPRPFLEEVERWLFKTTLGQILTYVFVGLYIAAAFLLFEAWPVRVGLIVGALFVASFVLLWRLSRNSS